jgi:hypothetical protein
LSNDLGSLKRSGATWAGERPTPIKKNARFKPVVNLVERAGQIGVFVLVGSLGSSEQDFHHGGAALGGVGRAEALTEVWWPVAVPKFVVRYRFVGLDVSLKLGPGVA